MRPLLSLKVDPGSYAWLRDSAYAMAGCVTVVAEPDVGSVEYAFGCGAPIPVADPSEQRQTDGLEYALVASLPGGVLVLEDNGFQGTRAEVLGLASKASAGRTASIFWNVNGVIRFTCARKGKLVCSFELGEDEAEIVGLPAALRTLVQTCAEGRVDLVAAGAAMVETYTGVRFGPEALDSASLHELTPPPSDLETDSVRSSVLSHDDADLHLAIAALPDPVQRQLAEWVTQAAAHEAGVDAWDARWEHTSSRLEMRDLVDDDEAAGRLETSFAHQRRWAGEALRYSSHPDSLTAAVRCVHATLFVFSCSRTERPVTFTEDDTGRWSSDSPQPAGREPQLREVLAHLLSVDPVEWEGLRTELPVPMTTTERDLAIRRDQEREAAGDFDTWQHE